ncbi:MAG: carboxylesterase family protein [Clostridia bacterium]|nr:carboxylesterase family protein [Clostridia bacterium]
MRTAGVFITAAVTAALMAALLELNKNSLWGFAALAVLAALFVILAMRVKRRPRFVKRLGLWAAWAALFAGVFFLSWPPVRAVPATDAVNPARTEVVAVKQGQVRGVVNGDGVEIFAGIPYAAPPVGELRWKAPQDPAPWSGVLEADSFAPMSMQPVNLPIYDSLKQIIGYHDYKISLHDNYVPPVSEDSLYLNVWRPAGGGEGLPVLVYVHGGSLQTGQPWWGDYSGAGLAKQGVIVVNMGYRLGAFGFLASEELAAESPVGSTGNYGLMDQIKALEWVRDNIAAFGGDPQNVTLSGESAGAACVSALCTSPLAKGLFRRAVLESSAVACKQPPHSFRLLDEAYDSCAELLARHNCKTVAELRNVPAEELADEAYTQHHITVDGYVLEQTPYESYKNGRHNEEALLHGYNAEEAAAFILFDRTDMKNFESKVRSVFGGLADEVLALYPVSSDGQAASAWAEIWGALFFDHSHYVLSRLAAENGVPVYEYTFTKNNGRLGPWHSGEEVYLYANIDESSRLFDERDRELMGQMSAYLVNFIKTGDPNGEGLPEWPDGAAPERIMEFGDETAVVPEKKLALFDIISRLEQENAYVSN